MITLTPLFVTCVGSQGSAQTVNHMLYIIQVNKKLCNLEKEYRDCIKSRRNKVEITRHIIMHQVLYIVQLPNEEGDMHII